MSCKRGKWLAAIVVVGGLGGSSDASACSGPVCIADAFLPFAGNLPANAAGVLWLPGWGVGADTDAGTDSYDHVTQASDLRWTCTDAEGASREVSFHADTGGACAQGVCGPFQLLVPDAALQVDEQCTIEPSFTPCDVGEAWFGSDAPAYLRGRSQFTVTPAAPLPTALGAIDASATSERSFVIGSDPGCDQPDNACGSDLTWALGDAEPWRDALVYTTYVDGKRWAPPNHDWLPQPTGGSWQGRGRDLVFRGGSNWEYASMEPDRADVSVRVEAMLPGLSAPIRTADKALDLRCERTTVDAGATPVDASLTPVDASLPPIDAGFEPEPPRKKPSDGGCSTAAARPSSSLWPFALTLVMLARSAARRGRKQRVGR